MFRSRLFMSLLGVVALTGAALTVPAGASDNVADCSAAVQFDVLQDGGLPSECLSETESVVFDEGVSLPVPESGEWVAISVDTIDADDAVEAVVYSAENGDITAMVNGDIADPYSVADEAVDAGAFGADITESTDSPVPQPATTSNDGSPNAKCSDSAQYTLATYGKFQGDLHWRYNTSGEPTNYTSANHRARIEAGLEAWELYYNSCALDVALPNLWTYYDGQTTVSTGITANASTGNLSCALTPPTVNVAGWANLTTKKGTLGANCRYSATRTASVFNTAYSWYSGPSATGCTGTRYDLGGIATHEWGHALGLDHYNSYSQVMNATSGTCETTDRNIGRGDLRGLRALYGSL